MNDFAIILTELLMFYNGDNVIFVLSSFLPLSNQNIVDWDFIIYPIALILSKWIFNNISTFENYNSSIANPIVRHQFY